MRKKRKDSGTGQHRSWLPTPDEEAILSVIGAKARALREGLDISAPEAAELMGTTQSTVSAMETGNRHYSTRKLTSFLLALGLSVEDLCRLDDVVSAEPGHVGLVSGLSLRSDGVVEVVAIVRVALKPGDKIPALGDEVTL